MLPEPADAQIAAATFGEHLDKFFANPRRSNGGWERTTLDPLTSIITVPAIREDGTKDSYVVMLEGHWYDSLPPRVTFVDPVAGWPAAQPGSSHYPVIVGSPLPPGWQTAPGSPSISFALHSTFAMTYGETRQLACFSQSFDYYFSGHGATEDQRWRQGVHTVSATLTRLHAVLQAPDYIGPSDAARP